MFDNRGDATATCPSEDFMTLAVANNPERACATAAIPDAPAGKARQAHQLYFNQQFLSCLA
jgi:hypothetical protein